MRRQLENTDDWDDGCGCGNCESGCENDDEDSPTVPCPYCGREIYEDSPRCPHCGQYISEEDAAPSRASWWIILGVVLCLCAVVVWIVNW
jgi:predicted nucleic acid-binding Zn ribbon protein